MGVIRTFGLIFFLTILIGGCIVANNSSPQLDITDRETIEVSWETALGYLQSGDVRAYAQADQIVILILRDGSIISAVPPANKLLEEEMVRCGMECGAIVQISY